jgi:hypothetical protein
MTKLKPRWIIALVLLTLGVGLAVFPFVWPDKVLRELEKTRRELRQQGFKIDLAEFDLAASAEQIWRASAPTNAGQAAPAHGGEFCARNTLFDDESLNLMKAAGPDAAVVVWKQEKLALRPAPYFLRAGYQPAEDLWAALREIFKESQAALDAACEAALSGPIRFDLNASHGGAMLLPHLAKLKVLAQLLGTHAVLELHDRNKNAAWTLRRTEQFQMVGDPLVRKQYYEHPQSTTLLLNLPCRPCFSASPRDLPKPRL